MLVVVLVALTVCTDSIHLVGCGCVVEVADRLYWLCVQSVVATQLEESDRECQVRTSLNGQSQTPITGLRVIKQVVLLWGTKEEQTPLGTYVKH